MLAVGMLAWVIRYALFAICRARSREWVNHLRLDDIGWRVAARHLLLTFSL